MQSIKAFKEMILSYLESTNHNITKNNNITKKTKDELKVFIENNFNSTVSSAFESIKSSELFEHCLAPFLPQKGWLIFWKYKNPNSTGNANDGVIGIVKKVHEDKTKEVIIFNTDKYLSDIGYVESKSLKKYEEENVGKLKLIGYAKISLGLGFNLKEFNKISNVKINTNIDLSILDLIDYLNNKPYYENKDKLLNSESNGKYKIYTEPYILNIIGIRSCIGYTPKTNNQNSKYKLTNEFDDKIIVFRKIPGLKYWQIFKFDLTTKHGIPKNIKEFEELTKKNKKHPRIDGDNIVFKLLAPGQYRMKFTIGNHLRDSKHKALKSGDSKLILLTSECSKYLIYNKNGERKKDDLSYDFEIDTECIEEYNAAVNIHTTITNGISKISTKVNNWSMLCQVFQDPKTHQDIFIQTLCNDQDNLGKNSQFTYTLIEEFDFLSYIANQKQ